MYLQLLAKKILPHDMQTKANLKSIMRHSIIFTNLPGPEKMVQSGTSLLSADILNNNNGYLTLTWMIDDIVSPESSK
jgi:hypothetical protein